MNKDSKMQKIVAVVLAVVLLVSVVIFKISTSGKANEEGTPSQGAVSQGTESTSVEAMEYEKLFEKDRVIDIKVEIADSDWKSILSDPLAEEYKSATVTVEGVTLKNVGFRTKGNLTLRSVANSDSDRYSFRIKMDKYENGQNLLGLDELVVNNMYSDPSYLREYLSYEALKEIGAKVPETVFANIYINGELYGFYLCVEAIDDSYLERNFGDDSGNLYKQEQGSTLQYVEGSSYDKSELKTGDDEAKEGLKNFIKALNEMPTGQKGNIESVLDVDSALRYIAANTVLGNYDSYNGNMAQNYYLYDQEGKITVLPWDYNMSLAGFGAGASATTIPIDEPVSGVNIKNLPMINNLLAVDEYKTKYHEYVKELLTYLENFESRVTEVSTLIRPYVQADPSKFYTMEQFEASIKYSETASNTETAAPSDVPANANENPGQMPGGFGNNGQQMPPQDGMMGGRPNGNMGGNTNGVPPNGNMDGNTNGRPNGNMGGNANGGNNGNTGGNANGRPNGNMNGRPNGNMGGNMGGGPNGGGMMGNATSIINYVRDRVANITKQLAGELPTTGNTSMNDARGGNRGNW